MVTDYRKLDGFFLGKNVKQRRGCRKNYDFAVIITQIKVKVKQSRYRPGVAQRVPEI
jgi:hypothetical protein